MTSHQSKICAIANNYVAAWNSHSAEAVAKCYAVDGEIIINDGTPWQGRSGIAQMAAGFYTDVPDIIVICDDLRIAGNHVVFIWTFTGTHSGSKKPLRVVGWEEWDIDADLRVKASRGWYDAEDYARQVAGHGF